MFKFKSPPLIIWLSFSSLFSIMLAYTLVDEETDSSFFTPGEATHGHHQIEMKCNVCHTEFGGVKEQACLDCHAEDLQQANDSHPKEKFTDPRNSDRLESLAADKCITCHTEHQPGRTHKVGVTIPMDYCHKCHEDVGDNRPSHKGMAFNTCATSGCHNYHDNTALYEDFLVKHAKQPDHHKESIFVKKLINYVHNKPLEIADADFAQAGGNVSPNALESWSTSAHAKAHVNCSDCHGKKNEWIAKPQHQQCQSCHEKETKSFMEGHHGMRLAVGLSPMKPSLSKLPMKQSSAHKELTCTSCHSSHGFDRQEAAYLSCIKCHNDQHSNMYAHSKHFSLWSEKGFKGGVSCATCHMPRVKDKSEKGSFVQHNQNHNLRPNEKMIRSVCMNCHGLKFSIDALADEDLIQRNFIGQPSKHIESIDMSLKNNQ